MLTFIILSLLATFLFSFSVILGINLFFSAKDDGIIEVISLAPIFILNTILLIITISVIITGLE